MAEDKNQKPEDKKKPTNGDAAAGPKGEVPDEFIEQKRENVDDGETVNNDIPEVGSASKKRNFLIVGIVVVLLVFVAYGLIGGGDEAITPPDSGGEIAGSAVDPQGSVPIIPDIDTTIPELPALSKAQERPGLKPVESNAVATPPPIPGANQTNNIGQTPQPGGGNDIPPPPTIGSSPDNNITGTIPLPGTSPENQTSVFQGSNGLTPEQARARINSPMVVSGGGGISDIFNVGQGGAAGEGGTAVPVSKSRVIGDTTSMIAQGKVIDAVLETAINTDLPGFIRAVVSRDVYAESGKKILVPKGSRLVGQYSAEIRRGQGRVFIVWDRVIRPDGIDIMLESPGIDPLGRQGLSGDIDNKYFEIFSNSLLFSTFNFAFAAVAENVTGSTGISETNNPDGTRTVSGKASDRALSDSVQQFSNVVKSVAGDIVSVKPTMTIDQGTKLKVFVNKDLFFDHDKPKTEEGLGDLGGIFR